MNLEQILTEVREKNPTDTVMISFSRGKDAWGVWCALKDKIDFQPFHYYCGPPHLEFIDEYMGYAERKIGKHIINLPAPAMYSLLSPEGCVAQPPHRVLPLLMLNLQPFTFEDVQDAAIQQAGLPKGTYTALGVRASDSARRALFFKTHGPVSENRKKFYPIWDWNKEKLMTELKRHDVKLPIDYKLFGRSFDGLYYMYLQKIREHYPKDYQRICEYFPFIDMEIYRYEKRKALGF